MASPTTEAIHVVGAAILSEGRCVATRRSARMAHPGKWEFPGGKVEPGESPRQALRREVAEELGIAIAVGEFLARGQAPLGGSQRLIRLDVYAARWTGGEMRLAEHDRWGWFGPDGLEALAWPAADLPAVARVVELLRS